MYKNALKEDLIRVVEELDGIVESSDTIVKLKTKIENSSTFESDPDFVKTLIQNCIDEREYRKTKERFSSGLHGNTAADSVRSEWPLWHAAKSNAVFARRRIELKQKLKLLD
ncbi:hypothetical protein TNCV_3059941 [Trichonephila clavipes]|nr:hypothetical protein TNCV_3059941 [Trichonephila clavipes]